MSKFQFGGPKRMAHQIAGLRKIIETRGVCALLLEPGLGKQQPLTEPVLTPEGWRPIGSLRVDDLVIGSDGLPTRVLGVYPQTERQTYRVTFNDGTWTLAGPEHLWSARTHNDANRDKSYRVVTTEQLRKTLSSRWEIPITAPVVGDTRDLPCSPYLLGAFLGDGSLGSNGHGSICTDLEIIQRAGLKPTRPHGSPGIWYASISAKLLGIQGPSRSWEKEIPEDYMRADAHQRLELLQGLLDTDGSPMIDGGVEFTSVSEELVEQVSELVESLGGIARRRGQRLTRYTYRGESKTGRTSWRVNLKLPAHLEPFSLSRKAAAYVAPTKYPPKRVIRKIERVEDQPSVCIRVEAEDSLYLTRHHIVTHNTAIALDYLSLLTLKAAPRLDGVREARALVIAPSVAVDTWVLQSEQWLSPQVDYWAEALGGSTVHKAQSLAARGGNAFSPRGKGTRRTPRHAGVEKSLAWAGRAEGRASFSPSDGLEAFRPHRPRLILAALNFDAFAQRRRYGSGTIADHLLEAVKRFSPDVVILDESHRIKGAGSNTSRLLARIGRQVPRRLILTGTVMPHSPMDVFGQWRFLEPTAFGDLQPDGKRKPATFSGFKSRYAVTGGYGGYEIVGYRNLDKMQEIMARNSIVARKEDALDLPPSTTVKVPVRLSPAEETAYRAMKKDLAVLFAPGGDLSNAATAPNRLAQMMRLRQITSGFLPDDGGGTKELGTSKVDTIASIVQDTLAGEKRVVVFCQFRHEIEKLKGRLAETGTRLEIIEGDTSPADRIAIRKRFGDLKGHPERIVLVAQIRTVSLAVNEFVTASHAVFGSMSLRRDDVIQAQDRLTRKGQTRPVTFWYALAPRTVDEVIYQAQQERTDLEAAILDHIQSGE